MNLRLLFFLEVHLGIESFISTEEYSKIQLGCTLCPETSYCEMHLKQATVKCTSYEAHWGLDIVTQLGLADTLLNP